MAETDEGWILHSLAQGRKFGPLGEDELRNYFRAGMVKSVDRLSAPGDAALRPAAEVAQLLGVAVPPGPPPPELAPAPAPLPPPTATAPTAAAATANTTGLRPEPDAETQARIARAMAAANLDFSVLAGSSKPAPKRSWTLPMIAVFALIGMMLVALSMAQRLRGPKPVDEAVEQTAPGRVDITHGVPAGSMAEAAPPVPPSESAEAEFQAGFNQAERLAQAEQWPELVVHATSWARANPARVEPLRVLGMAYARSGDAAHAIETLESVLARNATDGEARRLLADAYLQAQRWPQAVSLYKELVAAEPQNARLWNNYGSALFQAGEKAQAEAALQTAVRIEPGFAAAWTNLGNLYQANGDGARAAAAFANAKR